MAERKSLTVIKGEDRSPSLRILYENSSEPFPLTDYTEIQVVFEKSDRSSLIKSSRGYKAEVLYEGITYTANEYGDVGNSIELTFDAVKTIEQVVDLWNAANPTNTVTHDSSTPSITVPPADTVELVNGVESAVTVIDEKLGKIRVTLNNDETNSLKIGKAQDFRAIIDKGEPPTGERRVAMFLSKLNVLE